MAELNKEKLLNTDFIDRFLSFIKKFDDVCSKNTLSFVQKWIDEEEYDYIKSFLFITSIETMLPITIHEFTTMTPEKLLSFQNFYIKLSDLLNEKQALYEELNSFYE